MTDGQTSSSKSFAPKKTFITCSPWTIAVEKPGRVQGFLHQDHGTYIR